MLSVDEDNNVLDDKKEAVVMMSFQEKKLLTTEKVTRSHEVHKRTDKISTNVGVEKGTEKLEDMKEAVVTIRRKYSYKFEDHSKGHTGWFNLDHELKKRKYYTHEPDFY